MTAPASRTKSVWSVSGTGKKGTETHEPILIRPMNAAEYAIILDLCRSPNIVNHKKIVRLTIKKCLFNYC
jgi:hypothetical protein